MYYLLGLEKNLSTIFLLCQGKSKLEITSQAELKQAYLEFLKIIQPKVWRPDVKDNVFLYDPELIADLIVNYLDEGILTDFSAEIRVSKLPSMHAALREMQSALDHIYFQDKHHHDLLRFTINTLFYAESYQQGGGSVSSAIGVIWCANRKNWTLNDSVEFLVHELTHNLVFLDELRYQHYVSLCEIAKQENFAVSAVLKKPRPLDKVFHSLIVAVEILSLRLSWLGEPAQSPKVHPPTWELYLNCCTTLSSVKQNIAQKGLVTSRFIELLALIEAKLNKMEELFTTKNCLDAITVVV